jgi:hypothetical protein
MIILLLTVVIVLVSVQGLLSMYATGVIRGAADQGARAGAPEFAGAADCAVAANKVLSQLLGGPLGANVRVECSSTSERSVARAVGSLPSLIPGIIPPPQIDVTAVVRKEPEYGP